MSGLHMAARHVALAVLLAVALAASRTSEALQQVDIASEGASVMAAVGGVEEAVLMLGEQGVQLAQQQNVTQAAGGRSLLQAGVGRVAWRGRFDSRYQLGYFSPYIIYSSSPPASLRNVVVNPVDPSSRQPAFKVTYPKGSWSPSGKPAGGTLFYAYPNGDGRPIAYVGATLQYDVYLPPDFQFVKGGKLPGLAGGPHGCGGGVDPVNCWSVRVMWRTNGNGEAYMYVPEGQQGADFCTQPPYTKCDYAAGVSLSRGAFKFTPGSWHRIGVTVRMNDVGKANGVVEISLNGQRKIYYNKVMYRTKPGIQVDSVVFSTWFGGGDASWSPPAETYSLFKNIRLYRADPPTGRPISTQAVLTQQTTVTLPLQDVEPQY